MNVLLVTQVAYSEDHMPICICIDNLELAKRKANETYNKVEKNTRVLEWMQSDNGDYWALHSGSFDYMIEPYEIVEA